MELIEKSSKFAISLLSKDQAQYLVEFGLDSGSTRDKFAGIELEENSYGMPIVKDSCGWSICEVKEMHDIGEEKNRYW